MAPKQPCAKYQYVVTASGPKIVPVPDVYSKDEESPADYNSGGYLPVKINDSFKDGRYLVLRKLGWGHFSTVWLAKDNTTRRHCALKVVKSAGRYAETARDEIKLLRQVMDANPSHRGRNHVVSFLDSFDHPGPEDSHICLVFEPLGENLLALIERHKKTGVAVDLVKVIAKQMLLGLQYLHDECDLVHTDIKPENILISIPDVEAHIQSELSRSPSPTSRKVIIPPKQATRASVSIPHHHKSGRERQVQIFDSQPLASPSSHSCPNSPARLSYISRVASAQSALASFASTSSSNAVNSVRRKSAGKLALATGHYEPSASTSDGSSDDSSASGSGSSSSASRYGSVMVSSSVATSLSNDTPPTSVASVASGIGKMAFTDSPEAEKASSPCTCTCGIQGVAESTEEQDSKPSQQPPRPVAGPSLLSQTAPADLKPLPSATTCSQHPHLPSSSSPHPHTSSQSDALPDDSAPLPPPLPISIKIADLGNATPTRKHYTEDIQTRQYRAPEAIVGRTDWGATADIWSVACVLFELLTAEYLFDPQSQGDLFGKDDDHVAQIIELLGDYGETKWGGRFSRELFDSSGSLRYIRNLKPWPLKRVMVEKYLWSERDAEALCEFLLPMLTIDHRRRAQARDMVDHPWLEVDPLSEDLWGW